MKLLRLAGPFVALLSVVCSSHAFAQTCPAGLACFYVPPLLMPPAVAPNGYSGDLAFSAPSAAAQVTYLFGSQSPTSVSVPAGSAVRLSIPTSYGAASDFNVAENRGAFVTSTARDLLVEQRMTALYWQSSSTSKPHTVTLGTRFRVAGYALSAAASDGAGWDYIGVYAPQNTTVTASAPPGAPSSFWYGYEGATATFSLTAGQTYLLRTLSTIDIDGSLITSTTPISLVVGGRGWGSGAGDDGADAVVPMSYAGSQYVITNYPGAAEQDVRVVADSDNTVISINGSATTTLNAGGVYKFVPSALTLIESSQPVVVFQNAAQNGAEDDIAFIPPVSFASVASLTIAFNVLSGSNGTAFVLLPSGAVSSIRLDGATVTLTSNATVAGHEEWSGVKFSVTAGNHTLSASSDMQFGLVTGNGGSGLFGYDSPYRRPGCPDANVDINEGCDDGNTLDGDGCSSVCEIENGFSCTGKTSVCSCSTDVACASTTYCSLAIDPSSCAALLPSGTLIPEDHGVCGGEGGNAGNALRVCTSGACNAVTNTCGGLPGAACEDPSDCAGNVCTSGVCGQPNGAGPCTPDNAGSVCQSGACSTSGYCVPAVSGSCAADSDCAGSQFCRHDSFSCNDDLGAGTSIPDDGLHGGSCSAAVAVCSSGLCNASTVTCASSNESECEIAADCASNICGSNWVCGIADRDSGCTTANATALCQSGVCSAHGNVCLPEGGVCWVDSDCNTTTSYCNRSTTQCVSKLASGQDIPSDTLHTGTCTVANVVVCQSGQCNSSENTCADANGTSCEGASSCASNVCGSNFECGLANGQSGCDSESESLCQSGACSASQHCVSSGEGRCWVDSDCSEGEFCFQSTFTCAPQLAPGVALPVDGLHDVCEGASAACTTGKCNATTTTCADDNRAECDDHSQCISDICGSNHLCGLADGQEGCDDEIATSVCQSGGCSPNGLCVPPDGCWIDDDCLDGQYCNRSARECHADESFGDAIPDDGIHGGVCSSEVAAIVCQSQLCNTVTNTCARANDASCADASQCVSNACGHNGTCGYGQGELGCTQETANYVCQSGICSVGGACIPSGGCYVDVDCPTEQHCNRNNLACVNDLPANTPIPNDGLHNGTCSDAVGQSVCKSGSCNRTANTCASLNLATCAAAGDCVSQVCGTNGLCGLTNGETGCTATTAASVCQSGVCSSGGTCIPSDGCYADSDCASGEWCDRSLYTCQAKLAAGAVIPSDGAHSGSCSSTTALSVCDSGACNEATNTCALANASACDDPSQCASNICSDGTCGSSGNSGCTADSQCQSGSCIQGLCTEPSAYVAGHGVFSCAATGGDGALFEVACVIAALFYIARRKRAVVALVALVMLGGTGIARAQEAGFALERYAPAAAGSSWLGADSLSYYRDGSFASSVALRLDQSFAHDPLIVRTSNDVVSHVVSSQATTTLGVSALATEKLRLALFVPMQAWADGTTATDNSHVIGSPANSTTLGDLQVSATYRFYGDAFAPLRLAATTRVGLPTGSRDSYAGDGSVSAGAAFTAAGDYGVLSWSASLGGRWRQGVHTSFAGVHLGPEAFVQPAIGLMLRERTLLVGLEMPVIASVAAPKTFSSATVSIEPTLGAHWCVTESWRLHAAASTGLTDALGAPSVRGVFALEWVR